METMKRKWGKPVTQVQQFVPQEYCDGACLYPTGFAIMNPYIESNFLSGPQSTGEGRDGTPNNGYNPGSVGESFTNPLSYDYLFIEGPEDCVHQTAADYPQGNVHDNNFGSGFYTWTITSPCKFIRYTNTHRDAIDYEIDFPSGCICYHTLGAAAVKTMSTLQDWAQKNIS